MTEEEKRVFLQWTLERQLHWITAADTKAAGLIALYIAIAAIAATLLSTGNPTTFDKFCFGFAGMATLPGGAFALLVFFPNVSGGDQSLVFFEGIKKLQLEGYSKRISALTQKEVVEDLIQQIEVNSRIASAKHANAKVSIGWAAVALLIWIVCLATVGVST